MARVVLLGPARQLAGTGHVDVEGSTVAEVTDELVRRFGPPFAALLDVSRIWVDGEPADAARVVDEHSELSILPPVSGGAV